MQQKNVYPEIIKYYFLSYKEIYESLITLYISCFKIKKVFKDEQMVNKLKNAIHNYLNDVYKELEILKFIWKNEKKLYLSDIYYILDKIDDNFEERYKYYEFIYENLKNALDMELEYKFYIPKKRYKELTFDDIEEYKKYVKGFSKFRVQEFLENEGVLTEEQFNKVNNNALKIGGNIENKIELFGIYTNKIVLPKIDGALSTLINIHELTHYSLIKNENKLHLESWITHGEDIPIFYELLFRKNNSFVDVGIHTTPLAIELLETYNDEPFEEQINKLRMIKR